MSGAQVRSIVGLSALGPGRPVTSRIRKPDGRTDEIPLPHALTHEQIGWFGAGAALNAAQADPAPGAAGR